MFIVQIFRAICGMRKRFLVEASNNLNIQNVSSTITIIFRHEQKKKKRNNKNQDQAFPSSKSNRMNACKFGIYQSSLFISMTGQK